MNDHTGSLQNKIKCIVFFDLDGTLLDNDTDTVPESSMHTLNKLKENNCIVCLSTGRDMDTHYSRAYMQLVHPDAVIHLNGNKISIGEDLVFRHIVAESLLHEIYDYCTAEHICVGASVGDEDFYTFPEIKAYADSSYNKFIRRNFRPFEELFARGIEVSALSFAGDTDREGRKLEAHFSNLKLFPFSNRLGADIVEDGFSKADGMLKICDYYGVSPDRTYAFGDSQNDIPILKAAHAGIAMGNADEPAKAAADYVTDDIKHDGIYKACVRYGLI